MGGKIKRIVVCVIAALMAVVVSNSTGLGTASISDGAYAATVSGSSTSAVSTLNSVNYVVQWGDSLYKIASAYGISVASLKSANGLTSDTIYAGSTLSVPLNRSRVLKDIINGLGLTGKVQLKLVVDKSDKLLTVYNVNNPLKTYHVELGDGGSGDKRVAGDHKTPEGSFYITQKLVLNPADEYLGTRWMRLSYPNIEDAQRGLNSGLIDKATYYAIVNAINNGQTPPQNTALGGGVGVHGGSTPALGMNWTWGCVGLSNADVQDFYDFVKVGTQVIIHQ